jgi:hypothetical protein
LPHYAYTEIAVGLKRGSRAIRLESTDRDTVEQMVAELVKLVPSSRVRPGEPLPSGQAYSMRVERLGGRAADIAWWVLRWLCLDGWEPLGSCELFDSGFDSLVLDQERVRKWQFRKAVQ